MLFQKEKGPVEDKRENDEVMCNSVNWRFGPTCSEPDLYTQEVNGFDDARDDGFSVRRLNACAFRGLL